MRLGGYRKKKGALKLNYKNLKKTVKLTVIEERYKGYSTRRKLQKSVVKDMGGPCDVL